METNFTTRISEKYIYFAGNDYLGLARNPKIAAAANNAILKYGVNFSASRLTTGTSKIHLDLERKLAKFKNQEDAVTFGTGYLGNKLLIEALKGSFSQIIKDSFAHPSITDAFPKDVRNVFEYDHLQTNHLEDILRRNHKCRSLIITDGVFALTGEIAPLDEICYLAEKYEATIIVDDAHATGVLGKNGRGTPDHFNLLDKDFIFQSETMSKAMGVYGGFISSKQEIIETIRCRSNFYGASTALPPPITAAAIASVELIQSHPELRERLKNNVSLVCDEIQNLGYDTIKGKTPIIPILFSTQRDAEGFSGYLKKNYIIAPAVNYPSKMNKAIVRITVSANHTKNQIDELFRILKKR